MRVSIPFCMPSQGPGLLLLLPCTSAACVTLLRPLPLV